MKQQIYIVGGSIRDQILSIPHNDTDYVAVGYSMQHFENLGYAQIGKAFPVFLTPAGEEVALARRERKIHTGYSGFQTDTTEVTLEEDLGRRDLTINSIAKHPTTGEIIDPYEGQRDLKDKILRHTSEAFTEDPVRVLRLARFRAKFPDFKIHKTTKVLAYNMREELKSLQPDRVWKEVEKALTQSNTYTFFETLFELGVLDVIFPNINTLTTLKEGNKHHMEASVFEHTMRMLELVDDKPILIKLAVLFHDIAKPEAYRTNGDSSGHDTSRNITQFILNDLQVPIKLFKKVLHLINGHVKLYKIPEMSPGKVATFVESFKRDQELFNAQIILGHADDEGRITKTEVKDIDPNKLVPMFLDIAFYSPVRWLEEQKTEGRTPTPDAIKNHIHMYSVNRVKHYYKK